MNDSFLEIVMKEFKTKLKKTVFDAKEEASKKGLDNIDTLYYIETSVFKWMSNIESEFAVNKNFETEVDKVLHTYKEAAQIELKEKIEPIFLEITGKYESGDLSGCDALGMANRNIKMWMSINNSKIKDDERMSKVIFEFKKPLISAAKNEFKEQFDKIMDNGADVYDLKNLEIKMKKKGILSFASLDKEIKKQEAAKKSNRGYTYERQGSSCGGSGGGSGGGGCS